MTFGRGRLRHRVAGMSPHRGVQQGTTALPVGLHWFNQDVKDNPAAYRLQVEDVPMRINDWLTITERKS